MKVILFPANKLSASICDIYNGHQAIVCLNTDRLIDNHYAVAELELFRNDLQGTSFLNPRGHLIGENADYIKTISDVGGTGRISFGMYFNTDAWISPITGLYEIIPDYSATTWTEAGDSVFANAVAGEPKAYRYPNHGKEMYDISSGAYGFNTDTGEIGMSNLSEYKLWGEMQADMLRGFGADNLTSASYMNGANSMHPIMLPYFIFVRNSLYSKYGDANTNVTYTPDRGTWVNKRSNTRVWDAAGGANGDATSWAREIGYAREQVALAILNNGYYSDFVHWHSVYGRFLAKHTLPFFGQFYTGIRAEIGSADVWTTGNGEAGEYLFLRDLVRENCGIGSYESDGKIYLFFEFYDKFKELSYQNVAQSVPMEKITTPISIEVDLTATSLAGKNIICRDAKSIRSLGNDKYIFNVAISELTEGFRKVVIQEAITGDYYNQSAPSITSSGDIITSDIPAKWVIWRKLATDDLDGIVEVVRHNDYISSITHTIEAGYNYYIGAISRHGHSSLIELN